MDGPEELRHILEIRMMFDAREQAALRWYIRHIIQQERLKEHRRKKKPPPKPKPDGGDIHPYYPTGAES